MKKKNVIICICAAIGSCVLLSSCALRNDSDTPPLTQLQIREIQTREFESSNQKLVMKAMMDVLQDDGYIIKNAASDVGLLSAEKNIDSENTTLAVMAAAFGGHNARWEKDKIFEASANISKFGKNTRVRVNFQVKTMDNFGRPRNVETLMDPSHYQDFFDKVSKALFIQEQGI